MAAMTLAKVIEAVRKVQRERRIEIEVTAVVAPADAGAQTSGQRCKPDVPVPVIEIAIRRKVPPTARRMQSDAAFEAACEALLDRNVDERAHQLKVGWQSSRLQRGSRRGRQVPQK